MRTTINVSDDVLADILKLVNAKTKTEAINRALTDYVRIQRLEKLRGLRGKLNIDLDVEQLRELELNE